MSVAAFDAAALLAQQGSYLLSDLLAARGRALAGKTFGSAGAAGEHLSEETLNTMASAIIKKLDVDGDGEISLEELMLWLDSYPDADVTDLFALLQSVIDSGE